MPSVKRLASNRLVLASLLGTLVWFADQPTVAGYHPLMQMFWDPGLWHLPSWDFMVLVLSWFVTTIFCHIVWFAFTRGRQRTF